MDRIRAAVSFNKIHYSIPPLFQCSIRVAGPMDQRPIMPAIALAQALPDSRRGAGWEQNERGFSVLL